MKIDLRFIDQLDLELFEKGITVLNIRIIAQVRFKTPNGWLKSRDAILDTGSPISVLPKDIWNICSIQDLTDYEVGGIVRRKECTLKGRLGKAECLIHDDVNETYPFCITAFLAPVRGIPIILGFYNVLTEFGLYSSYCSKQVWLEKNG